MVTLGNTVTLVATVRNEMPDLPDWLSGIACQSRTPDEIIIVDGGSDDGTWQHLQRWAQSTGARAIQMPGANISAGRNEGIQRASGDIVVVTDAGTRADPQWLERLAEALHDPQIDVACGFFAPDLTGPWDRALAATTLPDAGEINPERFLPSSRSVAFRRSWWLNGVQYPVWLDYCEDLVWDLAMQRAGARFHFVPSARVMFRVRPNARAFATQYYRYARGDGKAGLFPKRHIMRYAAYAIALIAVVRHRRSELLVAALLGGLYVRTPLVRLRLRDQNSRIPITQTLKVVPLVPLLRVIGDAAKMAGYPAGLRWRWRRYGTIGWTTSWRRISPDGSLWRPGALSKGSQPPTSSPDA